MNTKTLRSTFYILWGVVLIWGVVFANNMIYEALSTQHPHVSSFLNDIFSDAVMLFVAFMPVIWAPLLYRLLMGETPFGANTWFFEGVVVPFAEEGLMRGILFSMLLWGFQSMFKESTAGWLTVIVSTLVFASAHLNNLGSYPTGFVLFQVGFSTILGLAFGYTRMKTESIYPAIILHGLFNLAGTL